LFLVKPACTVLVITSCIFAHLFWFPFLSVQLVLASILSRNGPTVADCIPVVGCGQRLQCSSPCSFKNLFCYFSCFLLLIKIMRSIAMKGHRA
jgi:hypothetical protein